MKIKGITREKKRLKARYGHAVDGRSTKTVLQQHAFSGKIKPSKPAKKRRGT
jgi:hypothetical protein